MVHSRFYVTNEIHMLPPQINKYKKQIINLIRNIIGDVNDRMLEESINDVIALETKLAKVTVLI